MFEGRILQCNQGHSVCESCVKEINRHLKNECPQCRGAFNGTRNYILEEMVKQLKHLKASVMVKKPTATAAGTSDANANPLENGNSDADDTEMIDDMKLSRAIATLVASIPKPSTREPAPTEPIIPLRERLESISMEFGIGDGEFLYYMG